MAEVNVTKELLNELRLAAVKVMDSYKLNNSNVEKSIEYEYSNDQFVLLANDYFTYIDTGRKPKARKVPVEDLIKWMKRKGITPKARESYNSIAYAISQSIYKSGIKAKPFINPIVDITSDIIADTIAEQLSFDICDDIVNAIE